jgi:DNA-binding IclR family transcriptional regulator
MAVINFLAAHPAQQFSLSDLSKQLSINTASLHTVLTTLTDGGYLERDHRRRTYMLGAALVPIGAMALAQHPMIDAARTEAERLSERMKLDVSVCARSGTDVAVVAHSGIRHPRGLFFQVGHRMPLRPPLGSIFYAWADAETVAQFVADDAESQRDRVRHGLAVVAARGFSVTVGTGAGSEGSQTTDHLVSIEPTTSYDVSSITGPVFDEHGAVVLTIAFVGFPGELSGDEVLTLGEKARDAGLLVTRRMRGAIPPGLAASDTRNLPK